MDIIIGLIIFSIIFTKLKFSNEALVVAIFGGVFSSFAVWLLLKII